MKRRTFITTLALGYAGLSVRTLSKTSVHRLFTPTYTGLGERAYLADPSNSLETHINDVLGVLTYEDLRNVITA